MIKDIIRDTFKCAKVALLIAAIVSIFFGLIYFVFYSKGNLSMLVFIKNRLYNVGCLGFLICAGFFIQRDATRPLDLQNKWNRMFHRFNLGIVVMMISLFVCIYGMIIQLYLE